MKRITAVLIAVLTLSMICIGCTDQSTDKASSDNSPVSSQHSLVTSAESEAETSSETTTSYEEETTSEPVSSNVISSETFSSTGESVSSTAPSVPPISSEPPVSSEDPFENVTYESYLKMSSDEQYAFIQTFDSPADFALWYHEEKAKYEAENPPIEIGPGGNIDLGGTN